MALLAQVSTQKLLAQDINISSLNGQSLYTKKFVVSTLGVDDTYISVADIGTTFFLTSSTTPQNVYLPDTIAAGSGWNILLRSMGFCNSLTIYDAGSNPLNTIYAYNSSNIITDASTWYFY